MLLFGGAVNKGVSGEVVSMVIVKALEKGEEGFVKYFLRRYMAVHY